MFYTFEKTVDGRRMDRYFQNFDAAKKAMQEDIEDSKRYGWKVLKKYDYFNAEKGIYVYAAEGTAKDGEGREVRVTWAVIELYFEDYKGE